ncbi:MAG: tetratricopeptide repeat protein [Prevotellaceae bacterium]|nr:tetratricopeptide repeat protein [Prevotellaceae bacterium]
MIKKQKVYILASVCVLYGLFAGAQTTETLSADGKNEKKYELIVNAKKKMFGGKVHEAEKLYREAIELDPKCDACYYELANIKGPAGEYEEAKLNAEKAYNLDHDNPWFTLLYAKLCFFFKEYEKAQSLFRHILKYHGNKQDVWLSLASSYEEQGHFNEASGILDSMVMRFGENSDITYRMFNIYANLGDYDKAIGKAKTLAENYPEDPRFTTLLADTYLAVGEDSLAFAAYNRAIDADADFVPALLGKAEAFRKKGLFTQYFKSLQEYMSNKAITPEDKAEYLDLVLKIPSFADYFKPHIDTLFAILEAIHPTSQDLKFIQARYFIGTKRPEISISLLGQLTDMDDDNKEAWNGLLSLEYGLKLFTQLETSSRKAIATDPKYAHFYMYLALALWSQDRAKQAIEILETGLKRADCDSVFTDNALSLLGDLYYSIKKPKKAFVYYEKALAINPENATVLNNYAYYLSLMKKQLGKAYEMSQKAITLEGNNHSFLDTFAYILYLQGKYAEAKIMQRQALAVGGSESAVVLDHYADILDKLGERNTAEIYWSQALEKTDCTNPDEIKKKLKR